ncbi:MAG: class I SAM-dependent methyltransferase [Mesorhizobium sp.]|nr:MAG: class I SAM-dependent methyltransferase [Mesorhizobium sp.]
MCLSAQSHFVLSICVFDRILHARCKREPKLTEFAQVDRAHYNFDKYVRRTRWNSFWYQLREVSKCDPASVLEVGPGDGTFSRLLRNIGIPVTTLDIASDLEPDILGSLMRMPIDDSAFDLVCAFQVLEHIPFGDVERALEEIHRVTRRYAVISVPDISRNIAVSVRINRRLHFERVFSLPRVFLPKHRFDGEHYWELGKHGFSTATFIAKLERYFTIGSRFRPIENTYHHFFICERR